MTWLVNGIDPLTQYGLAVSEVAGWQDDTLEQLPTANVPGVPGVLALSSVATVSPRRLVAQATVIGVGATLAIRAADARAKLDSIRALFGASSIQIVMNDTPTRYFLADGEQVTVRPAGPHIIADRLPVTISLVCRDPYSYDLTPTSVGLGGSMPLGTAPTFPVLTTTFGSSQASQVHSLVLPDNTTIVAAITITHAFAAGDVLVVDMGARTVRINGALSPSKITAGDFFYMDISKHGNYLASQWPYVRGGSPGDCVYRKAWR